MTARKSDRLAALIAGSETFVEIDGRGPLGDMWLPDAVVSGLACLMCLDDVREVAVPVGWAYPDVDAALLRAFGRQLFAHPDCCS